MPSYQLNAIFFELGWINKQGNGWVPTQHGRNFGAQGKVHPQSKVAYVVWPLSILDNNALKETLSSLNQETTPAEPSPAAQTTTSMVPADNKAFRERFPASHRTLDGHMVRSKGEVIIDNWLYMSRIVHAYERKLPIAEEVYCDFYLPAGNVYIEYWGLELDEKYLERKRVKIGLYHKYGLSLIQLNDEHIKNIDDHFPQMLLKHNISTL